MKEKVINILAAHTGLSSQELENLIECPPDPKLGDYAFPCFILSKTLKKNPLEIAQQIVSNIKNTADFEQIEAKGPYINFFVNRVHLANSTLKSILKQKEKYGSTKGNKKILIEFPSPNTNKPLHIGHARNIILGQSISNISSFLGNKVNVVNLNNDRGVHICKSMVAYDKFGKGDNPQKSKLKSDHLVGKYYVKFSQEAEKDKAFEEKAQEYLIKWEAKNKPIRALWKKMNSWAFEGFKETYKKFGLSFDKQYYESKIYTLGKDIILDQLKKEKVKKNPEGAIIIDLSEKGLGEKVLIRKDGTSVYITQDIYLAILKQKEFKFNKSLYVVAREQEHHFKVLFETLKRFGYSWADSIYHLSYGMVNLESGRMKSREGTVVDSDDLITELTSLASEEIKQRWPKLKDKEIQKRAFIIAMAAMRYYFLKIDRTKDMTFKPEESIKFEGDTGPYLLYSYARARSILKKAKYNSSKFALNSVDDVEKNLIIYLNKFPEIVSNSYPSLSPHIIANYALQLSQLFNEFYHSNKVIGAEDEKAKLVIVDCFSIVLKNSLFLLGIPVLEKM